MTPAQKQNCMLRTVAINIQEEDEEEEAAGEGQNEIINSQSALQLTEIRPGDWTALTDVVEKQVLHFR